MEPKDVGELNRRVVLKRWTDVPNVGFGIDQTFSDETPLWAKVEPVHGLTLRAGMNTEEMPTHLFWIRYSDGRRAETLTQTHVFEFKSRRYRIVDAINFNDEREWVRCSVKDLGAIA